MRPRPSAHCLARFSNTWRKAGSGSGGSTRALSSSGPALALSTTGSAFSVSSSSSGMFAGSAGRSHFADVHVNSHHHVAAPTFTYTGHTQFRCVSPPNCNYVTFAPGFGSNRPERDSLSILNLSLPSRARPAYRYRPQGPAHPTTGRTTPRGSRLARRGLWRSLACACGLSRP